MDGAILKQCRRPAKNKIHRTLYITMVIELTTVFAISIQSNPDFPKNDSF